MKVKQIRVSPANFSALRSRLAACTVRREVQFDYSIYVGWSAVELLEEKRRQQAEHDKRMDEHDKTANLAYCGIQVLSDSHISSDKMLLVTDVGGVLLSVLADFKEKK